MDRRSSRLGSEVSNKGVLHDLRLIVEGAAVSMKRHAFQTDPILFTIASASRVSRPNDLAQQL